MLILELIDLNLDGWVKYRIVSAKEDVCVCVCFFFDGWGVNTLLGHSRVLALALVLDKGD